MLPLAHPHSPPKKCDLPKREDSPSKIHLEVTPLQVKSSKDYKLCGIAPSGFSS